MHLFFYIAVHLFTLWDWRVVLNHDLGIRIQFFQLSDEFKAIARVSFRVARLPKITENSG